MLVPAIAERLRDGGYGVSESESSSRDDRQVEIATLFSLYGDIADRAADPVFPQWNGLRDAPRQVLTRT